MSAEAPREGAPGRDRIALGLVALLFVLHAALYPFAALVVDSGRDLANGFAIAAGAGVPTYGPALFGTWHLGPAWYVLLALPLAVTGSVGATAVFVGVLAALKIPLAYRLGRRLGDRTLALLCAAAAALPGWQILGALVLSHTALVETLLYATLLCCVIAVRRRRPWLAVLASLLLALALHAHPTALLVAPAVAWALWRAVPPRATMRGLWCLVAALVFVLPFLPVLIAEAQAGWPQLAGTGRYLGGGGFGARLARFPEVAWGVAWHGSVFVREFLLSRAAVLGWLWQLGIALAWLAALAGAVRAWRARDRRPLLALLAWLLAVAFVCLLRDATPAWMTYALAPVQALAWAFGWRALVAQWRGGVWLARGVAVFACVVAIGLIVDRVAVSRAGLQALPGAAVGDVAQAPLSELPSRFWLTARGHDAVMRRLCAGDEATVLHGDLAAAIDFGQGVAAALHCATAPLLGGRAGDRHLVGVPRDVAMQLGLHGETLEGFTLIAPRRVLFPERGVAATPDTAYRADTLAALSANGMATHRIDAACDTGDWLVVTHRLPDLDPLQLDVRDASGPRAPQLAQLASRYYACDGAPLHVKVQAIDPAAIDIVVLPAR